MTKSYFVESLSYNMRYGGLTALGDPADIEYLQSIIEQSGNHRIIPITGGITIRFDDEYKKKPEVKLIAENLLAGTGIHIFKNNLEEDKRLYR